MSYTQIHKTVKKLARDILASGYDLNNQPLDHPRTVQWIDEVEKKLAGKQVMLVEEVSHYFVVERLEDRWICYSWDAEDIAEHLGLT